MFIDKDHSQFLLAGLSVLRQNKELCDVELRVGNSVILAHKVVLAAVSVYFKAMFTGRMEESMIRTVNLHDVDEKSIYSLVDFAYTGVLSLSVQNVQVLLVTANMLGISKVINACCEFLTKELHPSNCIGFLEFSQTHSLGELQPLCMEYVKENFSDLKLHDEFLHLNVQSIKKIISNDNINCVREDDIFNFIEQWVLFNPNERLSHFQELFSELRLIHLSSKVLRQISLHSFVNSYTEYSLQLKINQVLNMKLNPFRLLDHDFVNNFPRRRECSNIMVVGGRGGLLNTLTSCSLYSSSKDTWKKCKELPFYRVEPAVASINGVLYLTGGMATRSQYSTPKVRQWNASVLCYCPLADAWSQSPGMNIPRSSHACVVHGGYLYVLGGYNGSSCLKSVECYNPATKTWSMVPEMNYSRSSFAAVILEDYIYVLGGQGTAHLCSVERYDTKSMKWDMVPAMSTKRINFGAAQMYGFLFVVGGHDGQDYLRSVERFDPVTSEWTVLSPLPSARTGIGCTVLHNHIYVVGGHDGSRYLDTMYMYNPCQDKWIEVTSMLNRRCYMAVTDIWIKDS